MKLNIAIAAALAALTLTTPALATDSTMFTINHLNQSAGASSDRIVVGPNGPTLGTSVSSMGDTAIGAAINHFNASVDSAGERVNSATVTLFPSEPAHGADIFEQMRLEDDDN